MCVLVVVCVCVGGGVRVCVCTVHIGVMSLVCIHTPFKVTLT